MKRATPAIALATLLIGACAAEAPAPATAPPVAFETLVVEARDHARERSWDGVVEAVNQATLSAQTRGRVLELPFDVNDYVEAGQVVVRFTDVEQVSAQRRASAALNAAQADYIEAESSYRRTEELVKQQLLSRASLDQARARRDAARAALDSARAGVSEAGEQVDYTVIRAPYSGILTQRHVEVGESVQPGQPLVSGLSLQQLRVNVEVPQSDVATIREHGQATVVLPGGGRVEAAQVIVFPYADPATHSFKVRVELPEAETGLQPGATVKGVQDRRFAQSLAAGHGTGDTRRSDGGLCGGSGQPRDVAPGAPGPPPRVRSRSAGGPGGRRTCRHRSAGGARAPGVGGPGAGRWLSHASACPGASRVPSRRTR
ncbi:efflux RND transporter periplasmic adaptor subunit [Arenimonas daejeonensis]|uniref:efflux RND transporter periplasmic adaptor subunit n=1 Tax=Arenimonas daejeonensis TaxID=370777 RepID=UPI0011BF3BAC|nr:efflux RND transporter periplasmic adaptor subunit [Arenimonas daejeonensis]